MLTTIVQSTSIKKGRKSTRSYKRIIRCETILKRMQIQTYLKFHHVHGYLAVTPHFLNFT